MLTQQQINNFRLKARQQGFNEMQIEQEIARKQQETTRQDLKAKTQQPVQAPVAKPQPFQSKITQSPTAQKSDPIGSAVNKVTSLLIPRIQAPIEGGVGKFTVKKHEAAFKNANENLYKKAMEYTNKALKEKDPTKKKEYIKQSVELTQMAKVNSDNFFNKVEQTAQKARLKYGQGNVDYGIRSAIGAGGEGFTWAVPAGKLVQGARLVKGAPVVQKLIQAGIEGGIIGGVYNATDPEDISIQDRAINTVKGFGYGVLTSGGLQAAGQIAKLPSTFIKKLIKENPDKVKRLFSINPALRDEFRASTGGMNFEEEILKRDVREMAGKNYEELIQHFGQRKQEAINQVENILSQSKEKVNKNIILNKVKSMTDSLAPEKGNVGQTTVVNSLKGIVKDLEKNPEQLTMTMANNIKRQLQDLGDAAYNPNGEASATTKKIASLATYVKDLIENLAPEVKDANQTIQLYSVAKKAIARTGSREYNKVGKDFIGQALQKLPPIIGGAAGLSGGFQGSMTGLVLGGLTGTVLGSLRNKYFTPEVQTRMISLLEEAATKNKVKNPSQFASKIADAIGSVIKTGATQKVANAAATGQDNANAVAPPDKAMVDAMLEENNIQTMDSVQNEGQSVEPMQPDPNETVTIRNKQTGETRQVTRAELSQYGVQDPSAPTQSTGPSIPTKKDILVAMMLDLQQTGGKNLSKLDTLLKAYESVYEEEDKIALEKELKKLKEDDGTLELSDTGINVVNEAKGAISDVQNLRTAIKESDSVGPIKGLSAKNPYDTDARNLQAEIDRVRQVVGKALEDGVLRKEDEEKYKKILPVITDTKQVAVNKLDQLEKKLKEDLQTYVELQRKYGKGAGQESIVPTVPTQ